MITLARWEGNGASLSFRGSCLIFDCSFEATDTLSLKK